MNKLVAILVSSLFASVAVAQTAAPAVSSLAAVKAEATAGKEGAKPAACRARHRHLDPVAGSRHRHH